MRVACLPPIDRAVCVRGSHTRRAARKLSLVRHHLTAGQLRTVSLVCMSFWSCAQRGFVLLLSFLPHAPHSVSVSVCLSLSVSLSLSVCLCLCLSFSVSVSLSLSLYVSPFVSVSLSLSACLSVSVSLSVSQSVCLSIFLSLSPYLHLPPEVTLCGWRTVTISLSLPPPLFPDVLHRVA